MARDRRLRGPGRGARRAARALYGPGLRGPAHLRASGDRTDRKGHLSPVRHGPHARTRLVHLRHLPHRFHLLGVLVLYGLLRLQQWLPLNPQALQKRTSPDLAFNTAISFVTNTSWQSYAGESTLSSLSQMAGITVSSFLSGAAGIAVAIALIRGFARSGATTIGNFWVDLTRAPLYVFLPLSIIGRPHPGVRRACRRRWGRTWPRPPSKAPPDRSRWDRSPRRSRSSCSAATAAASSTPIRPILSRTPTPSPI